MKRRTILFFFVLSILAALAACRGGGRQMTSDEAALVSRLEKSESTGRLDDLEIEYWIGGGLPPPYYRSDQLRFLVIDGRETVELNMQTHDEKRPNLILIEYRMPLRPETLKKIARLIRESGVFTRRFAEEEAASHVPDRFRIEVMLMNKDDSLSAKRRYYGKVPSALSDLESEVKAITDEVQRVGSKQLLDRNFRPIE